MSEEQRFWSHVRKSTNPDECWEWQGTLRNGYGEFKRHIYAHRYSYQLANGPIPNGMMIDHICFNRRCVNPQHLRLATNSQNMEHLQGAFKNNKSCGIRGVTWAKHANMWKVQVCHNYHRYRGGYFHNLAEAEQAAITLRNKVMQFNDLDRTPISNNN
ncbi:HNH endonuclease signature motif containing protein [Bifidobacterium aquikefiri]|uniref:HNH endonuclease signature motif containing protein n=2 Tax=Bifidobacterium aquikefiri TaxID=1653207 RepID=UPI0039E75C6B